jgi:hypothetical protein
MSSEDGAAKVCGDAKPATSNGPYSGASAEQAAADLALIAGGGGASIFNSNKDSGKNGEPIKSKNGRSYDQIADTAENEEGKAWDGISLRQDLQKKTKMSTSIIQGTGQPRKPRVGTDFQADIPVFKKPEQPSK